MKSKFKDIYLVINDHCNLNCIGCDGFSPLCKPKFYPVDQLLSDFEKLQKSVIVTKPQLMGGEPLLHPDIATIARESAVIFKGRVRIVTNGLKLLLMDDDFWRTCGQFKIIIAISRYHIHLKTKEIEEKAKAFGVSLTYYPGGNSFDVNLSLNKVSKPEDAIAFCRKDVNTICPVYRCGRLFHCSKTAFMQEFNKFFGVSVPTVKGIDIRNGTFKDGEIREIFDKSVVTCSHCHTKTRQFNWGLSKKKIEEWLYEVS